VPRLVKGPAKWHRSGTGSILVANWENRLSTLSLGLLSQVHCAASTITPELSKDTDDSMIVVANGVRDSSLLSCEHYQGEARIKEHLQCCDALTPTTEVTAITP
jgi:hypothetical protein